MVASVPVAGSVPSEQLETCLMMTCPVAVTVKKHGAPGPASSSCDDSPHGPCGLIMRWSASAYFFSAETEKAHAGPDTAGSAPAGRSETLGTSVVPAGQVPLGSVPTNPVTVSMNASGVAPVNVKVASFWKVGSVRGGRIQTIATPLLFRMAVVPAGQVPSMGGKVGAMAQDMPSGP